MLNFKCLMFNAVAKHKSYTERSKSRNVVLDLNSKY